MAKNATAALASLRETTLSLMRSSAFLLQHFKRKTELLSYLILCVAKMPFIPPVSIVRPRSVSVSGGLTSKESSGNSSGSSAAALAKTKVPVEEKGSSVKERLANLRQLGKKSQPRSRLPTGKSITGSGSGLYGKGRDQWLPSSKTLPGRLPASSSGESLSLKQQCKQGSTDSSQWNNDPEVESRTTRHQEEACFTLTLTPEAVLLLQRRSHERQQRLAARSTGVGAGVTCNTTESRHRRENHSKRHQPAARHSTPSSRAAIKNISNDIVPGDISALVKISLLNERYKYDDVEYEEEDDGGIDERVVLKCTEWLRGLENAPVTVGSMDKGVTSLKSF